MSKEEDLFKQSRGSPVMAYLSMKRAGENMPLSWLKRQEKSRQKLDDEVARVLRNFENSDITVLAQWEIIYQKEWFYKGLRCLYELDIKGKTEL
jgi:hypothetical protein